MFSGDVDSDKLKEEMERAKYDAEMKVAAEEASKTPIPSKIEETEKIGIEKRVREGNDDKVFKVGISVNSLKFMIISQS